MAGLCVFSLFFQLRVADEFKDFEDDCKYSPQRPVQRGLVSLSELGVLALVLALVQILAVLVLNFKLLPFLFLVWAYEFLMAREFFLSSWLRARPFAYLVSHMFILVLSDLFICACDFLDSSFEPGLLWFFVASFFSGVVIELGRKMKSKNEERPGVETYSQILGLAQGMKVFFLVVIVSQLCICLTLLHFLALPLALLYLLASASFLALKLPALVAHNACGKQMEKLSQSLVALNYLVVAVVCFAQFLAVK
jgi:4-hydroxybenzoate polyprenyltransferase